MTAVQVESFECVETASEPIEACEEAVGIMNELGLSAQLELVTVNKDGNKQRSPYREMTADELFVYSTLCPFHCWLSEYKTAPVPLRVLQIAAHAHQVIPGCKLAVWDKISAEVKDPVLVAQVGDSWRPTIYILARWGEVLETFSTLLKQAVNMRREKLIQDARSITAQVETLTDAEVMQHKSVQLSQF